MNEQDTTWLPNLVSGVSIWKLAPDLNEEKFFGGRLLVPETEGSESLPSTVRWNLASLLPLSEARQKHPAEAAASIEDFKACLDRAAKAFAQEDSGYFRDREALTVPSLEADGVENYFYSATDRRLYVINWGATPRTLAGQKEFLFGYAEFGKVFGAASAVAAVATRKDSPAQPKAEEKKDEKKDAEEEKKDDKGRPFWVWLLLGLGFVVLLLALLALMKTCNDAKERADAGPDAMAEGGAEAGSEAGTDGATDATTDAANEAGADAGDAGDAGKDASADAGDAGDAGKDGGKDAGDGGKKVKGKTGYDNDASFKNGKVTVTGGGGGGGGGGTVKVTMSQGPGGGSQTGPHRRHDHPQAVAWRIVHGDARVSRTEEAGKRFDVYLHKGESFDGVEVEYQDSDGDWHAH